ncbi:hypothetical protein [Candidatus Palauibacter sp.]|uniref:hypothetical protein n=1 Tax=Candidatus Palauibacter sp. TaxID=3101350 RepID=UPI003AF27AAF
MKRPTCSLATDGQGDPGRRIGSCRGSEPGTLLLCIASLHGNEPAGGTALERVLEELSAGGLPMRGDLVGLRGNLRALEAGRRFIDEDLNRIWQRDRVDAVLASLRQGETVGGGAAREADELPMVGSAELLEQRDLLAAIRDESRRARGPVCVLDLHTTSSESAPFTTVGDTLQNRELALRLPVPVVLGLEEQIEGALLQYFDRLGWRSIGFEGGRHEAPSSVEAHEDAVWILLEALGLLEAGSAPGSAERRGRLARRAEGLPRVLDVRYRHAVSEEDGFRMHSGFANFDRIEAGEEVGADRAGPVRAVRAGRILLPLYQRQGDDGFFIARRLAPAWLVLSRFLRVVGADRLATWLPGVRAHPERSDAVVLARRARNRVVVGLLHLLGFKARSDGGGGVMVRRVEGPGRAPESDMHG